MQPQALIRGILVAGAGATMLATAGCSDSNDGNGQGGDSASVRLSVTDAPVDDLAAVNVRFTGVTFNPAGDDGDDDGSDRISFDFEPRTIDLLSLTGGDTEILIEEVIPAGNYEWIRLEVEAERGAMDSFVVENGGGEVSLFIPSGSQRGLQLNGPFAITANQGARYAVDFDLRASVNDPQGFPDYILRPTLRVVDVREAGSIGGTVDPALFTDVAACDADAATGAGTAVYVYDDTDTAPDDIGSGNPPVATGRVTLDETSGEFVYTVAFLPPDDYRVAFTCQARADDPERDDDIAFPVVNDTAVVAGATAEVDFAAPADEGEPQ